MVFILDILTVIVYRRRFIKLWFKYYKIQNNVEESSIRRLFKKKNII